VVGALLVLAGLYQLSPLKRARLRQCQSPLAFFATSWRDGYAGALRMGIKHGVFCLGCCWLLFVLLFPLGVMNVPVMLALTLLIAAEKLLPIGQRVAQASGGLLIGVGALLLVVSPHLLPAML
jgi:predicted metal-binding membrane protein